MTNEADAYNSVFPTEHQQKFVTMMGIDPINYIGVSQAPWPVVPTAFANLAPVPIVPYRPPYSHPPQMALAEDPSTEYMVWPYAVNYDEGTGRWYADIAPRPGITQEGTYPPPGYFIRLALVRFQPYSLDDPSSALGPIETSPVALATFAQPVPDRSVIVLPNTADATHSSVLVTVSGPGYQGFRPPQSIGGTPGLEYDPQNYYAPEDSRIYGTDIVNTLGTEHSSTVVAEVQIQNPALNKLGLIGELAWETLGTPTRLAPTFGSDTIVTWGTTPSKKNNGLVKLPHPTSSTVKMRLRISEIDYYQGSTAPSTIDTSLRRPFVSIIDLN